jgi:hypothetical protein
MNRPLKKKRVSSLHKRKESWYNCIYTVKQSHLWKRRGQRVYSSYSFTTSALDGVSGQRHASTSLYPLEKHPVPSGQELGEPQSRSGLRC